MFFMRPLFRVKSANKLGKIIPTHYLSCVFTKAPMQKQLVGFWFFLLGGGGVGGVHAKIFDQLKNECLVIIIYLRVKDTNEGLSLRARPVTFQSLLYAPSPFHLPHLLLLLLFISFHQSHLTYRFTLQT